MGGSTVGCAGRHPVQDLGGGEGVVKFVMQVGHPKPSELFSSKGPQLTKKTITLTIFHQQTGVQVSGLCVGDLRV